MNKNLQIKKVINKNYIINRFYKRLVIYIMFNKLFLTKENISKYNKLYPYDLSKYLPSINDIPNLKFSTFSIVGNDTINYGKKILNL